MELSGMASGFFHCPIFRLTAPGKSGSGVPPLFLHSEEVGRLLHFIVR